MINDEKEKNNKEIIKIKFLLTNNNYNYMINDEKEKNNKEKITIKFLLTNNNVEKEKNDKKKSKLNFYSLIIIIII